MDKRLEKTGYIAFFLSGICAISSGIIVSVLQQKYGFSYGIYSNLYGWNYGCRILLQCNTASYYLRIKKYHSKRKGDYENGIIWIW